MSAVPTPVPPVWHFSQGESECIAWGNSAVCGPWHAWQPESKPPGNALTWLPSRAVATTMAKATMTSATTRIDIFLIAPGPLSRFRVFGQLAYRPRHDARDV